MKTKLKPIFYLILGTLIAIAAAMAIVAIGLMPAQADLSLLFIYMSVSGLGTILLMYFLYQYALSMWMNSLRWSLLVTVFTSVVLIFVNVWATAQMMFVSQHDMILTIALLVFGGFTALVFGWFIATNIDSKFQGLGKGIEELAEGNWKVDLPFSGNDEFSRLGKLLNWLGQRLQEVEDEKKEIDQTRRDLIAWISHDLRTPLTAIQASLEAVADDIVTEPMQVKDYVQTSLGEIEHLKLLIDDLFSLAQLDTGHVSLKFDYASISDLISDTVSNLNAHAMRRSINIHGEIQDNLPPVYIAPDKIQRVLYNLMDNAIRHSPEAGNITVSAAQKDNEVQVIVHNTGEAIAPQHLPHVFEKFYRGEEARQKAADGHRGAGLGLAIARGFVEAHGGRIWVESAVGKGTAFQFTLPIKNS
jgi:signal transduction histidine kinase